LVGISSIVPNSNKHFFLADFDKITEEEIDSKADILINKHKLSNLYVLKSGRKKGCHFISFKPIGIESYIKILKEIEACENFTRWVEKVSYGILRLSRRSSHNRIPILWKVFISPYREDKFAKMYYIHLLKLESDYKEVKRVSVIHDKAN
jgi:hypothetical protein